MASALESVTEQAGIATATASLWALLRMIIAVNAGAGHRATEPHWMEANDWRYVNDIPTYPVRGSDHAACLFPRADNSGAAALVATTAGDTA